MEKLIELLNEYEDNANNHYRYYRGLDGSHISSNVSGTDHDLDKDEASVIIKSKEYGFIKWLVENEKIDYEKVRSGEGNGSRWHFETVQPEYFIIMLLSIQDDPISFLCEILK